MKNYKYIRKLEPQDAIYMKEWMRNPNITKWFKVDFTEYNYDKIENFIENSFTGENQHFAIINEHNIYLGTISLKNISHIDKNAEYAIVLRESAQHQGYATKATRELIDYAFEELKLIKIQLNVLEDNVCAILFYERIGFINEGTFVSQWNIRGKFYNIKWYAMYSNMVKTRRLLKSRVLDFTEKGDKRGHLVAIEAIKDIPFEIKRVFYIYGSDNTVIRGQHANRYTEFVLINVCGASKVKIDNGMETVVVELDRPYKGVYIPKLTWKEMYDFTPDSVLLVLCNTFYDKNEYIYNYDEYLNIIETGLE